MELNVKFLSTQEDIKNSAYAVFYDREEITLCELEELYNFISNKFPNFILLPNVLDIERWDLQQLYAVEKMCKKCIDNILSEGSHE